MPTKRETHVGEHPEMRLDPGREHLVVRGIDGVQDRLRELVALVERVQEARQRTRLPAVADRIAARVAEAVESVLRHELQGDEVAVGAADDDPGVGDLHRCGFPAASSS
jgi:hypothetical protein